jgi:tRNA dimethylallyltransferase
VDITSKKEMQKIPHHLLDVEDPKKTFNADKFLKLTKEKIKDILKREKLPIICGGTGFYINLLTENIKLLPVKPNKKLREKLQKESLENLISILREKDKTALNKIDLKNKVKVIRAIEIIEKLGKFKEVEKIPKEFDFLKIGLDTESDELKSKIETRLQKRFKKGLIGEVKKLHQKGLSFKKMDELGLEYRYVSKFLKKEISKEEMLKKLQTEIWHYAKRQRTWFKRDGEIKWFKPDENQKIEKEVLKFLKN